MKQGFRVSAFPDRSVIRSDREQPRSRSVPARKISKLAKAGFEDLEQMLWRVVPAEAIAPWAVAKQKFVARQQQLHLMLCQRAKWQLLSFGMANCFRLNNFEKRLILSFDSFRQPLPRRRSLIDFQKAVAFDRLKIC